MEIDRAEDERVESEPETVRRPLPAGLYGRAYDAIAIKETLLRAISARVRQAEAEDAERERREVELAELIVEELHEVATRPPVNVAMLAEDFRSAVRSCGGGSGDPAGAARAGALFHDLAVAICSPAPSAPSASGAHDAPVRVDDA